MTEQTAIDFEAAELTHEQRLVFAALEVGRASAKTQAVLAIETGIKARRLREVIQHLIVRHDKMIGSASDRPAGYFLIENEEELEKVVKVLRHHAVMMLVRMSKLNGTAVEEIYAQEILPIIRTEGKAYETDTH